MKFYTSVKREKDALLVRGYDEFGRRVNKKVKYKPHLYLPSPEESEFHNLRGNPVKRMNFENMYEANMFMKRYEKVSNFSVYGFSKFEYPYIAENWPGEVPYDPAKISIGFIDIEVHRERGFPKPEIAEDPVVVISIVKRNKTYVLALKDYENHDPNVFFKKCRDEIELLTIFIELWRKLDFDIISGWYIDGFDIPYLLNRITNVMGRSFADQLSPIGRAGITRREKHGKVYEDVFIDGIAILDYRTVYKKFSQNQRDSYTLKNIAFIELKGRTKVDYSEYESLPDMWVKNPQKYILYNIEDTRLVSALEDQLKYLELVYTVSYDAKVNYNDALGSVLLWEVIIYNYLLSQNIVIPISKSGHTAQHFEGGHVKDPLVGIYDWVVSFDLTSLYPHIIMGWNISPETLMGKTDRSYTINQLLNGEMPTDWLKEKDLALAANACLYRRDVVGFLPELMKRQFALRDVYKKQMKEAAKQYELTKDDKYLAEKTKFHNFQWSKKIQLNSAYGAVANAFFLFYDLDNAAAVTATGRLVIQWAEREINKFLNNYFGTEGVDYVIASDTDSLYLSMDRFFVHSRESGLHSGELSTSEKIEALDKFSREVVARAFQDIFNTLTDRLNCHHNALHMKRENIGDHAIWRAKKHYAMSVWDSEGVRYEKPDLKIVGMETVRSTTPFYCRAKFKEGISVMFEKGEDALHDFIKACRKEYATLPLDDIARPIGVNDATSYLSTSKYEDYIKGSPMHVKATILYNKMLDELGLEDKYPKINDGDKIKVLKLIKINPIGEVIGAPDGRFPAEFELEKYVDRYTMFEDSLVKPLQSLLSAAGWKTERRGTLAGLKFKTKE